ncbi:MAG: hypothetical protein ACHQ53_03170 [Polyangiales bacterium]
MHRAIVCAGAVVWLAGCGGTEANGMASGNATQPTGSVAAPTDMTPAAAASGAPTTVMGQDSPQVMPSAPQGASTNPSMPTTQPSSMPAQNMPAMPAASTVQGIPPPDGFVANAMDQCGLHTKWPGDQYCISPPPPDKGFQLHIGPSNYDNPEPEYLLQAGEENVRTYTASSGNDKDIYFYVRQYRMRPGAHHTIVRDTSTGRRLSGSDVNQDQPVGGITAPENAGIGIPLSAHAPISVDHHAINTTQNTLLQEVWVNFWYVDPSKVTQATNLLYDPGDVTATIPPGADVTLGPYNCDIKQAGRLLSMFGHVHASDVEFSAWRTRGSQRDLIYDSFHWEEPLWLEFTSLAKNAMPDTANKVNGGWTGILDLQAGDTLQWQCHDVNQQTTTLTFTNQTYAGVMCIIIGDLVGTKCETRSQFVIDPSAE